MEDSEEKVLPVIDISLSRGPNRAALVKELHEALSTVGFIYLKGIEGFDEDELLRLTKWFYSLPLEKRMAISKKSFDQNCASEYRGFFPVIPGAVSHKEAFEIGQKFEGQYERDTPLAKVLHEDTPWPEEDTETGKHFKTWMENYYETMTRTALELMSLIAEGFGAPSDFYTSLFTPTHLSTLRLIHYPPRPNPPKEAIVDNCVIQTAEHNDSTVVTLLATFPEYPGLQVRWWKDNTFFNVPHRRGHLVVNIGDLLSHTTGGKLKATKHRVIDLCGSRVSVPFFLEPRYDANVNIVLPGGTLKDSKEKMYGPWLLESISKYAEYDTFTDRMEKLTGKAWRIKSMSG